MWIWLLVTSTVSLGAALAATIENPSVSLKKPLPTRMCRLHLASHHCGAHMCQATGRAYADLKPPDSHEKWKVRLHNAFSIPIVTWVFVQKIKAVIMKSECILHLITFAGTMHRGEDMISAYTSKKRSAPYQRNKGRSRAHGEQRDYSHSSQSST